MLTLSTLEQKLFFATRSAKHGIVSIETFKDLGFCVQDTLRVIISRLLKKGALAKLKRGLYAWNLEGNVFDDVFYVGQSIYSGYLAFSTALYLHGLTDQFPFTVFVATRGNSSSKRVGNVEFKAVAVRSRATGAEVKNSYFISTVAKTVYDCFHLPEYGGSYALILHAVYNAKMDEKQWREFLHYVEKFEGPSSKKKIGAYLHLLGETDRPVPKWVVSKLGKANLKLDKKELLSWWFA